MKHVKSLSKPKYPAMALFSSNPLKALMMKLKGSTD